MHAGKLLMKKLSNPKKHFLFTFVIDQSTHVHGYIMCTDKRYVEPAIVLIEDWSGHSDVVMAPKQVGEIPNGLREP